MNSPARLEISIDDQTITRFENDQPVESYPISTSAKGVGFREGSYRTPTGNFRISEKIGDCEPIGTIFKARVPVGTWQGEITGDDLILSRIIRIEGLDSENANTHSRYIYIHGTDREDLIGQPASHGCIRLRNEDMIRLFNRVEIGTPLIISPPVHRRGKLLFIDCDSTLSAIEGIDELARGRGSDVFAEVVALTEAAMNGEVPIHEVFPRRMEIIRPDRQLCDAVAARYLETIVPGAVDFVSGMKEAGWLPVILSGGFAPLIQPLADHLGIRHVEAVPLYLNDDGSYRGYDSSYPTTRNMGKNEVIREWKQAMLPLRVIMIGDGVSDLETKPDVDLFIGYGGIVARPPVKAGADCWLESMTDLAEIRDMIALD